MKNKKQRRSHKGVNTTLSTLPADCLRLILSKIDYADNKLQVWAVSSSCKAAQRALRDCPAAVNLRVKWSRDEVLGICSGLPQMTSLKFAPSFHLTQSGFTTSEILQATKEVDDLRKLLSGSKLRHLDLRDAKSVLCNPVDATVWHGLGSAPQFPECLQQLTLPSSLELPDRIAGEINRLTMLTHLDCADAAFWPSPDLIGLQDLSVNGSVGSNSSERGKLRDEFFASTLEQFTYLKGLKINCFNEIKAVILPAALQELRVTSFEKAERLLASSLSSVPNLRSLDLRQMPLGLHERGLFGECELDLAGLSFNRLRKLVLCNRETPPRIAAPHLTELCLHGWVMSRCQWLEREMILWMSTLTSVRRLELRGYTGWEDLKPLVALPSLTHLSSDQGLKLLADMLKSGCLQNLEAACLQLGIATDHIKHIMDKRNIITVAKGLAGLPRFRLLSCCEGTYARGFGGDEMEKALDAIVKNNRSKWRCLYSKGGERLLERV